MLRRPAKCILLPLLLLAVATLAGVVSAEEFPGLHFIDDATNRLIFANLFPRDGTLNVLTAPAWWVIVVYLLWNAYHFGMQNFGVMTIYRLRSGIEYPAVQRAIDKAFCLTVQTSIFLALPIAAFGGIAAVDIERIVHILLMVAAVFMLLREAALTGRFASPRIVFALSHTFSLLLAPGLWGAVAINGANHWLSAIGLAAHAEGQHTKRPPMVFAAAIILIGFAVFWLLFWNGRFSWNFREMMSLSLTIVCFRLGVGFVHFLYDRWVWKLSDPQVRATISRDLLTQKEAPSPIGQIAQTGVA